METIVTLKYKDKGYIFKYDWGKYSIEGADFMFEEGNYSCDCNKSIFIRQYCDKDFPEMECGQKIKLINLKHIL